MSSQRPRWLRFTIRAILGGFAVFGAGLIVMIMINPATLLLLGMLIFPLFGNTRPPPMFEPDIADMWAKWDEGSRKITAHLQQQFPPGTSEATLVSALTKQGFEPLPAPASPIGCAPTGQQAATGTSGSSCPKRDKAFVYKWGGGVCTSTVSVRWESDADKTITKVDGGYYAACL